MVDAIAIILEKLLNEIHDYNSLKHNQLLELLKCKGAKERILDNFQLLLDMIERYVNEETRVLFHEMKLECTRFKYGMIFERPLLMDNMIFKNCEKILDIIYGSNVEGEETVVGFDDEMETLRDQLTTTCSKQLQVFSIAGMAGLGKTTLARKLYTDPLIDYTFDFRAWICVSQTYLKRDLLLGILSSFITDLTDETYQMSNEQLGEKLYRLLKGCKYLVVMDDIWAIFLKKVFRRGFCPPWLKEYADAIIRKCEGLPLAIVITSGLLKNNFSDAWWLQISASLHSFMQSDPSQYMDSLDLSYNHLPPHLRHCFVFVGVFPEDYDIPVTKLIWLWIAQGLIHETESRILEDVAEDVFHDLIKRSLLMIAKKRADGHIKTCRIHDLLRDLCLKKANEESFFNKYTRILMHRHLHEPSQICHIVCQ